MPKNNKRTKTITALNEHKSTAISSISNFIDNKISGNSDDKGTADKFCYWLEDYIKFLEYEPTFKEKCKNMDLKKYKRGEIVKAHLGFNIGSEEGGLHYCVVVEKNNSIKNPVVTVVPLTSVKKTTDLNKLKKGSIFLGNELFTATSAKVSIQIKQLQNTTAELEEQLKPYSANDSIPEELKNKFNLLTEALICLQKTRDEFIRMKSGSIALVNQITTISKIRIYDPKTSNDPLAGIKLSNEKLDLIDKEIINRYTK